MIPVLFMTAQQENKFIAAEWFEVFNTKDIEGLLSLYHEDARHYSPKLKISQPETNGFISGTDALRKWWAEAFERLPSLHYVPTSLTENEHRVFMEYIRRVDNEPEMLVAEVLEIRNGRIIASRVYHG